MISFMLFSFSIVISQSISLDSVDGLYATNSIVADGNTNIVFYLRFTNGSEATEGISNGFRVYSNDGAEWNTTIGDTLPDVGVRSMFDQLFVISHWSISGTGADSIGFLGSKLFSTGLPAYFDNVILSISIGPIAAGVGNHGKTITLDSSFFQPFGNWNRTGYATPVQWDGPHSFTIVDRTLDVQFIDTEIFPDKIGLLQNYPNPFNPITHIRFDISQRSHVNLIIYNILGHEIRVLTDKIYNAGSYDSDWNSTDKNGTRIPSGIYLYRLITNNFQISKKMLLLK